MLVEDQNMADLYCVILQCIGFLSVIFIGFKTRNIAKTIKYGILIMYVAHVVGYLLIAGGGPGFVAGIIAYPIFVGILAILSVFVAKLIVIIAKFVVKR